MLALVSLLAVSATAARAQTDSTRANGVDTTAQWSPASSVNCGLQGATGTWGSGSILVDTIGLYSKSRQLLAAGWCVYLASGQFSEQVSSFARWSDAQLADELSADYGIEWARKSNAASRTRFKIFQTDSTVTERFFIRTTIESRDSTSWRTRALHIITAAVYKDTVRFESALVPRLASAMRWSAPPLQFVRLDTGAVDTARANAAATFVRDLRRRAALAAPAGEQVLYLYTKVGNGRDLLGLSQFDGAIDGFTIATPKLLFSNVPEAGEFYRHELVHVALLSRSPKLNRNLEEPLAKTLGGILHRSWPQFVCEERTSILDREKVQDIPSLFAKPDSALTNATASEWEAAFLIDYLLMKSGDKGLRALLTGERDFATRRAARISIAGIMGLTPGALVQQVGEYNSDKSLAQRCGLK